MGEKYLAKGYSYSRTNNPTVTALEQKLAAVEGGVGACAFGTGMAATTSVISGTMKAGDHCVITDCSYGGTNRSCREFFTPLGMEFTFTDFRDPDNVRKAMKPNTKLIFSETPANPTLSLCDVEALSKIAKDHGAKHVVDTTFATPVILRALDHGADMVIQNAGGSRQNKVVAERAWQYHKSFRGIHGLADHEDDGPTREAAERDRHGHRRISRKPSKGHKGFLPRPRFFPPEGPRRQVPPGWRAWGHVVVRHRWWVGGRHPAHEQHSAALESLREPRCHGEHHHGLRRNDAREHAEGRPPRGGDHRWFYPRVVRHRRHRRLDQGSGSCLEKLLTPLLVCETSFRTTQFCSIY